MLPFFQRHSIQASAKSQYSRCRRSSVDQFEDIIENIVAATLRDQLEDLGVIHRLFLVIHL